MRKIAKKDSYCRTNKCLTRLSVKDWMGKKKVTPGKRNTITIVWFATTLITNKLLQMTIFQIVQRSLGSIPFRVYDWVGSG